MGHAAREMEPRPACPAHGASAALHHRLHDVVRLGGQPIPLVVSADLRQHGGREAKHASLLSGGHPGRTNRQETRGQPAGAGPWGMRHGSDWGGQMRQMQRHSCSSPRAPRQPPLPQAQTAAAPPPRPPGRPRPRPSQTHACPEKPSQPAPRAPAGSGAAQSSCAAGRPCSAAAVHCSGWEQRCGQPGRAQQRRQVGIVLPDSRVQQSQAGRQAGGGAGPAGACMHPTTPRCAPLRCCADQALLLHNIPWAAASHTAH